jgi:hypothetical protein
MHLKNFLADVQDFASKGHHGMGGFDIHVSHYLDDYGPTGVSLKIWDPPINGPMDDEFFSITYCGKFAIFSKQVSARDTD